MPLMKKKSQKAFEHNLKAEMHAGKPQPQALAIAYSVKRRAKKASGGAVESGSPDMNMAEGGRIRYEGSAGNPQPRPDKGYGAIITKAEGGEINAKNERRPMPDNRYDDSKMISKNSGKKAPKNDNWLDQPTVAQAQSNNGRKVMPIKRPKMVPSDAFSTKLYNQEGMLEESASPGPYDAQPDKDYDEMGPNRKGPKVPDMEDEHSTKAKPYAKGGQIESSDRMSKNIKKRTMMEPMDDEMSEHERIEMDDHQRMDSPSEDEGYEHAMEHDEEGQKRQGPDVPDMEDEHSTGRKPYAKGGDIQYEDSMENEDHDMEMNPAHDEHSEDDSEMQPEHEEEEEHHNSIAAAIMAKKDRKALQMSDSDMDEMIRLYEGGEIMERRGKILSHGSFDTHEDADQADLSRNADEDANEEDQMSFRALEKENYSESEGLKQLDSPMDSAQHGDDEEMESENQHDMISKIRSKMKKTRQF
jgi:hypothetical protein